MRIKSASIEGFRGFTTKQEFDLDGDVIVVTGANGTGKTSLFDAVLWGLAGSVDRLGNDRDLVSRFSEYGECRVEVVLQDRAGHELRITRRYIKQNTHDEDGPSLETLTIEDGDQRLKGTAAEAALLMRLLPEIQQAENPQDTHSRVLTRSVYLEQDRIRTFVESDDNEQRYEIVGEIVGAGLLGDLMHQLESNRRAWTAQITRIQSEFEPTRRRHSELRTRLDELASADGDVDIEQTVLDWVRDSYKLAAPSESKAADDSLARATERALDCLASFGRDADKSIARLEDLQTLLADEPSHGLDVAQAQSEVARLEEQFHQTSSQLTELQKNIADARREALAHAEQSRSLAALARLALDHLDSDCPVCGQSHDRAVTETRLRDMIAQGDLPSDEPIATELVPIADRVRLVESELAEARSGLREAEEQQRRLRAWQSDVRNAQEDTGLTGERDATLLPAVVERHILQLRARSDAARELRDRGQVISARLARAAEAAQAARIAKEANVLARQIEEHDVDVAFRMKVRDETQRLHEAIRAVSDTLVKSELDRIEPVLQKIYSAVDPHPAFRTVKLAAARYRGRGQLWTPIEAENDGEAIEVDEPRTVLSSSQLNVLAVSIFLALNLAVSEPPLELIMLDDPLQNLDDVNLLGLADLLRRLRGRRQIILSSHDGRLASLLSRKLRPIEDSERTIIIDFRSWDTSGPTIRPRDIPRDSSELRLVAAS